jgi:hypothetical protein
MGKIVAAIALSLDGFVTGPELDMERGLGPGGEARARPGVLARHPPDLSAPVGQLTVVQSRAVIPATTG